MTWWVVVIEGEGYPEVVGPYRSEDRAAEVAAAWNPEDGHAHVRPCRRALDEVDD